MAVKLAKAKKRLETRRVELLALEESTKESRRPVELDQTRVGRLSRMDALQGQAMAQATAERKQIEIRRIEAALKRVEDGDYGYCLACDEPIAEARLMADPSTPLCLDCAAKRE